MDSENRSTQSEQPYILAVFDGRDRRRAEPVLMALYQSGCRILRDNAAETDERARETRATRLKEAALVLLFASRRALALEGWDRAVTYCVSRRTPVITLHLDDAEGTEGMQMQLSTVPSLRCADYRDAASLLAALKRTEGFTQSLIGAPPAEKTKNTWMRASALLLLGLTAAAALILIFSIRAAKVKAETIAPPTPPPGVTFADAAMENAVCAALGRAPGTPVYSQELAAVTELTLASAPATLSDVAMLPALQTLRIPQSCVPLCAPLIQDGVCTVIVEGRP